MSLVDHTLTPRHQAFRSTAWSAIIDAQGSDPAARDRALEKLVSVYWRPTYWTLRLDWNETPEDARDLAQEYFATFLEHDMVLRVQRSHGRFRHYVKATLKHFMLNVRRAGSTMKRGAGRRIVALDDLTAVEAQPTAAEESPQRRFDRELMRSIVHESLRTLERHCRARGHPEDFELFTSFYLDSMSGRPATYEDLRRRFGLGPHDVKNRLARLRLEFRRCVLGFLRDGTSSEDDLLSEIRDVFAS